jgi:uncharacterized protein YdeI (YjbR/CyaY-like superfamily)
MTGPMFFASPQEFRQWLQDHASTASELLVGFRKVGTGQPSLSWPESVDEALCFGWIDGVRRRIDEVAYSIRFTPRKPGSIWSAININKVEQLQRDGRMTPAGLAAFARRTEARSRVYSHEQPVAAALTAAERARFEASAAGWTFFQGAPPGYQRVMLHWVTSAKRPETRSSRLATLIDASIEGRRLGPA